MQKRAEINLLQSLLQRSLNQKNPYWRYGGLLLGFVVIVAYALLAPPSQSPTGTRNPSGVPSIPQESPSRKPPDDGTATRPSRKALPSDQVIVDAFRKRRSNLIVEGAGTIVKNLPDDEIGDRHQKFIVKLSSGHTVQIAHNIDLAPRVPAKQGDVIEFKGEYEYSEKGGVVHWTHHDPAGRHDDGWIRFAGESFN
jgi:Protein of unknown function (DUF3465)